MIKVGDILEQKGCSGGRKVLAIVDDLYALSQFRGFNIFCMWVTKAEIETGYIVPKEKWRPTKFEQNYWFIDSWGKPANTVFTADSDEERVMFGNCFQTKAEAELARDKIREVLKGE
jgi:hypothetical protein